MTSKLNQALLFNVLTSCATITVVLFLYLTRRPISFTTNQFVDVCNIGLYIYFLSYFRTHSA